jgi:hypothetical protein
MLVHHGAQVDVVEVACFLRMVDEFHSARSEEVALPIRIFEALEIIVRKSPPAEVWLHMALDAFSERPRLDVTTWLRQHVRFHSSDRAVKCVTRILALPVHGDSVVPGWKSSLRWV